MSPRFRVQATSSDIRCSAETAYRVLADYNVHHPKVLPPDNVASPLKVLKGSGVGKGTRFVVTFKVMGQVGEPLVMDVSEPEPGRVLQEIDSKALNITQFIIDPISNDNDEAVKDKCCRVTIQTDVLKLHGVPSWIKWLDEAIKRSIMTSLYKAELNQLNEYVQSLEEEKVKVLK